MAHPSDQFVAQELFQELGRLSFYFQQLETVIKQFIWRCFLDHSASRAMATLLIEGTPARVLGTKMLGLYAHRFGKNDARVIEMKDVAKEINRLNDERNRFLHSNWLAVRLFGGAATRLHQPRNVVVQNQEVEEIPLDQIKAAADACAELAQRLYYDLAPKFGHLPGTE
jgi:hypothetical protein